MILCLTLANLYSLNALNAVNAINAVNPEDGFVFFTVQSIEHVWSKMLSDAYRLKRVEILYMLNVSNLGTIVKAKLHFDAT